MTQSTILKIKSHILDATDGPVTKFVVIYRALQLVGYSVALGTQLDHYDVANVLNECLTDFEEISSNEFSHSLYRQLYT